MATRLQVTCINKRDRDNPHERILYIGGVGWRHSQGEAVANIMTRACTYYVSVGGYTVEVEIAYHNGNPYLRTKPDETGKDNLLALPECR